VTDSAPDAIKRERSTPLGILGLAGLFVFLLFVGYLLKGVLLVVDPKRNSTFIQFRLYRFGVFTGVLAAVGLTSAVMAFVLPMWRRPRSVSRTRASSNVIVWGGLAISFASFGLLVLSSGVSPTSLRPFSAATRNALLAQYLGRGYIGLAISIAPLFLLLLPKTPERPWPRRIAIFGVLLMFALLGSRLYMLGTLFSLALFHIRSSGRIWSIGRQAVLVIAVGIAGAGLGALLFSKETSIHGPYDLVVRGMATFDMADTLAVVENSPDRFSGLSVVEDTFVTYVPRAVWTTKPIFYGAYRLQEVAFPGIGNQFQLRAFFPVGFLGEAWLNFGLLGVMLLPYFTVRALRWLDEWATHSPSNLAYLCFIGGQLLGLLRSPGQFVPYAALAFIVYWLSTRVASSNQPAEVESPEELGRVAA